MSDAKAAEKVIRRLVEDGVYEENARLKEEVTRLRDTALTLLQPSEEYLDCIGECDHDVGICVCDVKLDCDNARRVLALPLRWFPQDEREGEEP